MIGAKEVFLERLLRTRSGLEIPSGRLSRHKKLTESLNSDLAIFVGGQVMDFIVQHEFEAMDARGVTKAGCTFSLPAGKDRWIQLFSIYSQQKAARSSMLLTWVLVVATAFTTLAAGIQAYCSYKIYKSQQIGQHAK